jgi:hypothetical protein
MLVIKIIMVKLNIHIFNSIVNVRKLRIIFDK